MRQRAEGREQRAEKGKMLGGWKIGATERASHIPERPSYIAERPSQIPSQQLSNQQLFLPSQGEKSEKKPVPVPRRCSRRRRSSRKF